jgi:cyclic lactone autoinducer peptide
MLKGLKAAVLSGLASTLVFVAQTGIGVNSMWVLFEPEAPKSLKK